MELNQEAIRPLDDAAKTQPEYKQSMIGLIPRAWRIRKLETLGRPGRPTVKAGPFGSSLTKDSYVTEGYKIYGQEQVIRGDHLYGDYYISSTRFNELRSCEVLPGDVLLSLVGTTGRVLVIPYDASPGIIRVQSKRVGDRFRRPASAKQAVDVQDVVWSGGRTG